ASRTSGWILPCRCFLEEACRGEMRTGIHLAGSDLFGSRVDRSAREFVNQSGDVVIRSKRLALNGGRQVVAATVGPIPGRFDADGCIAGRPAYRGHQEYDHSETARIGATQGPDDRRKGKSVRWIE